MTQAALELRATPQLQFFKNRAPGETIFQRVAASFFSSRRRLMRDFKRLQEDPPAGVSGAPGENDIMVWNAVIFGPDETPFADGTFKLMVRPLELPPLPRGQCYCFGFYKTFWIFGN
jgi:hypothetical protein